MSLSLSSWPARVRTVGVYGFALSAGLLAAWAVHEHIKSHEQELARQAHVETVGRVVVAADLAAGTRLQLDDLALRDVPAPWVPANSFDADGVDQVLDRRLATDLKQGEVLQSTHMAAEVDPPISDLVLPGRRAVTLATDEIEAAAGLLRVDDLIDLYVSFTFQGQRVTAPLTTGVRVLQLDDSHDVPAFITLDASENDAIKLVAARHAGTLTAVLRHRGDAVVPRGAEPKDLAAWIGWERPAVASRRHVPVLYGDQLDADSLTIESPPLEARRTPQFPSSQDRVTSPTPLPVSQE